MLATELSTVRESILPKGGDTWQSIAARCLSGTPEAEAVSKLQSWNLHVFMRASGANSLPFSIPMAAKSPSVSGLSASFGSY